jgi:hypothetical protein
VPVLSELAKTVGKPDWAIARSMLVYLGREWGGLTVREFRKRWHRDPSVIGRVYSAYAADEMRRRQTYFDN